MGQRFAHRHQFVETTRQRRKQHRHQLARCAARHRRPASRQMPLVMVPQLVQALMQIEKRTLMRRQHQHAVGQAAQAFDRIQPVAQRIGIGSVTWTQTVEVMRGST